MFCGAHAAAATAHGPRVLADLHRERMAQGGPTSEGVLLHLGVVLHVGVLLALPPLDEPTSKNKGRQKKRREGAYPTSATAPTRRHSLLRRPLHRPHSHQAVQCVREERRRRWKASCWKTVYARCRGSRPCVAPGFRPATCSYHLVHPALEDSKSLGLEHDGCRWQA